MERSQLSNSVAQTEDTVVSAMLVPRHLAFCAAAIRAHLPAFSSGAALRLVSQKVQTHWTPISPVHLPLGLSSVVSTYKRIHPAKLAEVGRAKLADDQVAKLASTVVAKAVLSAPLEGEAGILRGMTMAVDELYAAGLNDAAKVVLFAIRKRQDAHRTGSFRKGTSTLNQY